MARYLVEVSQAEKVAAKRIDRSVRSIGSHFATHTDWHRKDGVCTGSMVIEAADRWSAFGIVPPGMRAAANVFQLEPVTVGSGSTAVSSPTDRRYALAA
jgi:hypothetical protein